MHNQLRRAGSIPRPVFYHHHIVFGKLGFFEEPYEDGVGRGLAPAAGNRYDFRISQREIICFVACGDVIFLTKMTGGTKAPPYIKVRKISQ